MSKDIKSKERLASRDAVIQLISPVSGRVVRTIPGSSIVINSDGTVSWRDDAGNHSLRAEGGIIHVGLPLPSGPFDLP